ncbi:hypothetical protein [Moritella sp. F3]|uniref:hypothetical protein n=1 Tax=Moritella sp. F3 TaxID=2718882 RepID=UPI0018E0DD24|nr:hypothetical protein [Moritella sp. F3]GIC77172.1 hypothetical protein FMO001_18990 [Moritella sp. F1]GIC82291.1 hypothetical protein FMO003_25720 [Moritella sp. F3]
MSVIIKNCSLNIIKIDNARLTSKQVADFPCIEHDEWFKLHNEFRVVATFSLEALLRFRKADIGKISNRERYSIRAVILQRSDVLFTSIIEMDKYIDIEDNYEALEIKYNQWCDVKKNKFEPEQALMEDVDVWLYLSTHLTLTHNLQKEITLFKISRLTPIDTQLDKDELSGEFFDLKREKEQINNLFKKENILQALSEWMWWEGNFTHIQVNDPEISNIKQWIITNKKEVISTIKRYHQQRFEPLAIRNKTIHAEVDNAPYVII